MPCSVSFQSPIRAEFCNLLSIHGKVFVLLSLRAELRAQKNAESANDDSVNCHTFRGKFSASGFGTNHAFSANRIPSGTAQSRSF